MFLPDPAGCGPSSRMPAASAIAARTPGLNATERTVVLLARGDAGRFGWEGALPRRAGGAALRRLFVGLTGVAAVPALADPRLERLRLFACMMRRGDARAGSVAEGLLLDGYGEAALREAIDLALS